MLRFRTPPAPTDVARMLIASSEDVLLGRSDASRRSLAPLWSWSRHVVDPLSLMLHGAQRMATSFWVSVGSLTIVPLILYEVVAPLQIVADRELAAFMYAIWFYVFVGILSIRWLAGAALGVAAYTAKRGVDTSDGKLLVLSLVPFVSAGIVAGLVSIYARAVTSVYGLALSALQVKALRSARRQPMKR
jgi:hypothetical protein